MSERALWDYVRRGMGRVWHAQRLEDSLSSGIPDVSYALNGVEGWVELKYVERWPVRDDTLVRPGLTTRQLIWLKRRAQHGNELVFVLVKVDRTFMLFGRESFHALLDGVPKAKMRAQARAWWETKIDFAQLAHCLQYLDFKTEGNA